MANILFTGDMWSVFNFGDPNERFRKFLDRGRESFKRLIDGMLLYDKIVVPTQDFLILSILIKVLGEAAVVELLETDILTFIRLRGSLAYIGNGGGIKAFEIQRPDKKSPFCSSIDESIDWAINGLREKPKTSGLPELVFKATNEINVKNIVDDIRCETYLDVKRSRELRDAFALRNTDMNRLKGLGSDQVRIYGGPDGNNIGDEIDMLMTLAATNVEFWLSQSSGCTDASSISPVGQVLKAKALRSFGADFAESFTEFREISGVPDLGEAVLQNVVSVKKILKLNRSKNGEIFRNWFHNNCRSDPVSTGREYIKLLNEIPRIQSFPVRGIRFIFTTLIGMIPGAGPIASAFDSFVIEKMFSGNSPKFLVDKLIGFHPQCK